jgi:tetrahydromethanopterin S-methyltransferase subunit F
MKNSDRIIVYAVGFLIGMLLVSVLLSRRSAKTEAAVDPWVAHNAEMVAAGAEPLPQAMPAVIHTGRIIDFGYLPNETEPQERVWLLNFEESYPYVRVVESIPEENFSYMAADQIILHLSAGVDVTELKPMLDALGLRLRMFNRKERIAVVGVLSTQIDAVPATLAAVQDWSQLFDSAQADELQFKSE